MSDLSSTQREHLYQAVWISIPRKPLNMKRAIAYGKRINIELVLGSAGVFKGETKPKMITVTRPLQEEILRTLWTNAGKRAFFNQKKKRSHDSIYCGTPPGGFDRVPRAELLPSQYLAEYAFVPKQVKYRIPRPRVETRRRTTRRSQHVKPPPSDDEDEDEDADAPARKKICIRITPPSALRARETCHGMKLRALPRVSYAG